jgi:tetratricopeptide (TPR) repeat protein
VPARYFYSEYLFSRGRCAEARQQALTGLALDPLSAIATHVVGVTLYYCRAYDQALPYLRRALELEPQHTFSHYRLGLVFEQQRLYEQAVAEFAEAGLPIVGAYTHAAWGRPSEARRLVRTVLAGGNIDEQAYQVAAAYVALDEPMEAIAWLTRVVEREIFQAPYINADPRFDRLRPRPEFHALLRRAGLE